MCDAASRPNLIRAFSSTADPVSAAIYQTRRAYHGHDRIRQSRRRDGAGISFAYRNSRNAGDRGWGFQFWLGGDPKKPVVTDAAKQCFECHQPKKD